MHTTSRDFLLSARVAYHGSCHLPRDLGVRSAGRSTWRGFWWHRIRGYTTKMFLLDSFPQWLNSLSPRLAKRRAMSNLVMLLAALLSALACMPAQEEPESVEKPNLILISIDTLRADHLSSYGYSRQTSPFLDELAARGMRFEQAFVNTHGTTPSHTTMLSSVYQEGHRVAYTGSANDTIPEGLELLPEILAKQGYLTLGVTGGGNVGGKLGFSRGFEEFDDSARSIEAGIEKMHEMLARHKDDERPLFIFFHTYEVHSPYDPPEEYRSLYGESPSDFKPTSENLLNVAQSAHTSLTKEDLAHVVAMYDAGIRHMDQEMRGFFDLLTELGVLENAVFAVTSDHGEEFGEHGGMLHRGLLYDELLRVPLIFGGREISSGEVVTSLVSSVDIAPTLLACSGLEIPRQMQGRRIACAGALEDPEARVVSQYGEQRYSVRTDKWKLIEDKKNHRVELYDLGEDPEEKGSAHREHRRLAADLRKALKTWKADQAVTYDANGEAVLGEEEIEHLKALGYLNDQP